MNKKCIGCGVELQSTNKDALGYVAKEKINEAKYCERCFKIKNYNLRTVTNLENINNYILEEINKKAKYVYFMIDILNVNEETIKTFKKINRDKCLVISKLDIIPKSIKCGAISEWLKEEYGITERIIYQSSNKNIHTSEITNSIKNTKTKEAYLVGYTNSGKSTLINTLLDSKEKLTTSNNLNTTIDFIKIKIDDYTIIDSPGFTYENTFYNKEEFELIRNTNPKKFLKPITYQTKDITNLIIEKRLSIKTSIPNSVTFYLSNDINIERVFDNKKNKLLKIDPIEYKIGDNTDLVIKSLGFINIKKACTLKISTELKDLIEIRKSMFK